MGELVGRARLRTQREVTIDVSTVATVGFHEISSILNQTTSLLRRVRSLILI